MESDVSGIELELLKRVYILGKRKYLSPEEQMALHIEIGAVVYLLKEGNLIKLENHQSKDENAFAFKIAKGAVCELLAKGINSGNALQYIKGRLDALEHNCESNN